MGKDYLAHSGVKGMKWGVRRSRSVRALQDVGHTLADAKLRAKSPTEPDSGEPKKVVGAASGETSTNRYIRLKAQAKKDGGNSLDEQDLKFLNARAEALSKVAKMNEANPGWLSTTTKKVLLNTAEKQMQGVSDILATKYIGKPIKSAVNK